jgi:hypothetical protein
MQCTFGGKHEVFGETFFPVRFKYGFCFETPEGPFGVGSSPRLIICSPSLFNNLIIYIFDILCHLSGLLPADVFYIIFYSPGRFLIDELVTTSV